MTIYDIIFWFVLAGIAYAIWNHNNISIIARRATKHHCDRVGVQLLDQNIVLKRIAIRPSANALLVLERQYRFEFSSVGDRRYKGLTLLLGNKVQHIELEPYKTL